MKYNVIYNINYFFFIISGKSIDIFYKINIININYIVNCKKSD